MVSLIQKQELKELGKRNEKFINLIKLYVIRLETKKAILCNEILKLCNSGIFFFN